MTHHGFFVGAPVTGRTLLLTDGPPLASKRRPRRPLTHDSIGSPASSFSQLFCLSEGAGSHDAVRKRTGYRAVGNWERRLYLSDCPGGPLVRCPPVDGAWRTSHRRAVEALHGEQEAASVCGRLPRACDGVSRRCPQRPRFRRAACQAPRGLVPSKLSRGLDMR
jgi:hypothetical protein